MTPGGPAQVEALEQGVWPPPCLVPPEVVEPGGEGWVEDADFRFGLDLLLDGVEVLVERRSAAT